MSLQRMSKLLSNKKTQANTVIEEGLKQDALKGRPRFQSEQFPASTK